MKHIENSLTNCNTPEEKNIIIELSNLSHCSAKDLQGSGKKLSRNSAKKLVENHSQYLFPEDNFSTHRQRTEDNDDSIGKNNKAPNIKKPTKKSLYYKSKTKSFEKGLNEKAKEFLKKIKTKNNFITQNKKINNGSLDNFSSPQAFNQGFRAPNLIGFENKQVSNSVGSYLPGKVPFLPFYILPFNNNESTVNNQANPQSNNNPLIIQFVMNDNYLQQQQQQNPFSCFMNQSFNPADFKTIIPNILLTQDPYGGYDFLKDNLFDEQISDYKNNNKITKFLSEKYPASSEEFINKYNQENDTSSKQTQGNSRKEKLAEKSKQSLKSNTNEEYKSGKSMMESNSSIKNEDESSLNQEKEEVIEKYECVFSSCLETFPNKNTWQKHYELHLNSY